MLLHPPYNFPGKVKQITTSGRSSEITLDFDNTSLTISVRITMDSVIDLGLKRGSPAHTVILWKKNAIPPGKEKKTVTVRYQGTGPWVTIERGPATEAEIATMEAANLTASQAEKTAWSFGYRNFAAYAEKVADVFNHKQRCEAENTPYQVEAILRQGGLWETIPHGTDCEARIQNEKDKYAHGGSGNPTGDHEAWDHGYAFYDQFKAEFGDNSHGSFRAYGPFIAGFMYNGVIGTPDLFTSPGLLSTSNLWPITVNLYQETKKIGQSVITEIQV